MINVAVFFGGKSSENEISILTGVFVLSILDRTKYTPVPIYIHTDGSMYTSSKMYNVQAFKECNIKQFTRVVLDGGTLYGMAGVGKKWKTIAKIDVALNCCHGGLGEGGGISALVALSGIPLASPPLTPSGIFLDKCMTKTVLKALSVPTVDFFRVNEEDYKKRGAFLLKSIGRRLQYPIIVKPSHLGSSIGIRIARDENELKSAIENAFTMDHRILLEKFLVHKMDVNCAAYARGGEIFVSEPEIAFGAGMYSFEDKYIKRTGENVGGKNGILPKRERLEGEARDKIRAYTKSVYKRMNLQGIVRMDFLLSDGKVYLSEVNTVPGSLAYCLFCERISDARSLFTAVIEEAIRVGKMQEKPIIKTGILSESYRLK